MRHGIGAASFAADGEITTDAADVGLIPYNMATAVVAVHDKDPKAAVRCEFDFSTKSSRFR